MTVLTFWYGLAQAPMEQQVVDMAAGNFNTGLFRLNALVAVCLLQAWLMWNFIMFQVKRRREAKSFAASNAANAAKARKSEQERAKARKARKEQEEERDTDLPEVDQDTKKSLCQRVAAKKARPLTTLTCSLPCTMVINLVLHHMLKYFILMDFHLYFRSMCL